MQKCKWNFILKLFSNFQPYRLFAVEFQNDGKRRIVIIPQKNSIYLQETANATKQAEKEKKKSTVKKEKNNDNNNEMK